MCVIIKLLNLGVAQMVARYLGVVEAVGSSPATQTSRSKVRFAPFFYARKTFAHFLLFLLRRKSHSQRRTPDIQHTYEKELGNRSDQKIVDAR